MLPRDGPSTHLAISAHRGQIRLQNADPAATGLCSRTLNQDFIESPLVPPLRFGPAILAGKIRLIDRRD